MASEKLPRVDQLLIFNDYLMVDAPPNYIPHYFRCIKNGKTPAGEGWKAIRYRLSIKQAAEWMSRGGNIGIAAIIGDPLVNIDLDGENVKKNMFSIPTLMSRSRSRVGIHGFYFSFDEIPNISTEDEGEVRCQNQYVIAPGSYVPTNPETVPENDRANAGYYTVEQRRPPAWIEYDDLPQVFKDSHEKSLEPAPKRKTTFDPKQATGRHSALFDITATDVAMKEGGKTEPGKRWAGLFHDSRTGANMSLSNQGLLQCWRHSVSHNGLQALTVLSGYMTCKEAGSSHRGGGAGHSRVIGDNGAIFNAWLYAKKNGYIPQDDPIPVRAMHYIAEKHLGFRPVEGERLPRHIYSEVIKIVEAEY